MKLILNRDYTLATTKGHTIAFKKGVPTSVPPIVYADALAIGAYPEEGGAPETLTDEDTSRSAPSDPVQRAEMILTAVKALVAKNERKDFTAAGSPAVKAVEREVGFDVDSREVVAVWQKYHEEKSAQ